MLDFTSPTNVATLVLRFQELVKTGLNCWFPLVKDKRYFNPPGEEQALNVPKIWVALGLTFEEFDGLTKQPRMWTRAGNGGGWGSVLKEWRISELLLVSYGHVSATGSKITWINPAVKIWSRRGADPAEIQKYHSVIVQFRLEATRRVVERFGTLVHTEAAAAAAEEEDEEEEEEEEEEEQEEEEDDEDSVDEPPASPIEVLKHC